MHNSTSQHRELEAATMYLKDHLTKEWRDVARLLGLTDSEIHITNYEYHGNTKEKTYRMFVKWMQRKGTRASLSSLTHALRGVDRPDLGYALKKGEHLVNILKFQDIGSSVVKEHTKVGNEMVSEGDQQPKRKWLLVIVCVVSPVLASYLIYPVIIREQMNNDCSSDIQTTYNLERDTDDDGVFSNTHKMNERNNNRDTKKISEYELLESDHLEKVARYVKNSLTKEWQDVGRYLGLSHPDIEHINEQYNNNPKERNYQMLQRWREQYGNQASIEILEDALRKAGRRDLADNLHKGWHTTEPSYC